MELREKVLEQWICFKSPRVLGLCLAGPQIISLGCCDGEAKEAPGSADPQLF